MSAFTKDQKFTSFEDFRAQLDDWAIKDHFRPKFYKSDPTRRIVKCKDTECPFYIRASFKEGLGVVIVHVADTFQSQHTCLGATVENAKAPASTQAWLQRTLPTINPITKDTTQNAIIEAIQLRHGEKISYETAKKAKKIALNVVIIAQLHQFAKIPKYIDALKLKNPGTYTHLSLDPQSNRFQRIFICPPTSSNSFQQCRQFLAIDGTFMKSAFVQTLLLAVAVDGENHCLPIAWALVEGENEETWAYFLIHLKAAIPTINAPSTTVISDRDKGLASASDTHLLQATRVHCVQHLAENVRTRYGLLA